MPPAWPFLVLAVAGAVIGAAVVLMLLR